MRNLDRDYFVAGAGQDDSKIVVIDSVFSGERRMPRRIQFDAERKLVWQGRQTPNLLAGGGH